MVISWSSILISEFYSCPSFLYSPTQFFLFQFLSLSLSHPFHFLTKYFSADRCHIRPKLGEYYVLMNTSICKSHHLTSVIEIGRIEREKISRSGEENYFEKGNKACNLLLLYWPNPPPCSKSKLCLNALHCSPVTSNWRRTSFQTAGLISRSPLLYSNSGNTFEYSHCKCLCPQFKFVLTNLLSSFLLSSLAWYLLSN